MEPHYLVPEQQEGPAKDIFHIGKAASNDDAEDWFVDAKNRMLSINHWNEHAPTFPFAVCLTDVYGKPVNRSAHKGDHIRMDVPDAAGKYGWVSIDAIAYDDYPDEDKETYAIRMHSVSEPGLQGEVAAAFVREDASSTMVIIRTGKQMKVLYHGRNAPEELLASDLPGANAWQAVTDVQWAGLIHSFIE